MAKKGKEKQLTETVFRSLGIAVPQRHYLRDTHPDRFEGAGKPDLVGHVFGMHVEIELKVHPNTPSPHQLVEIRKVWETGGFSGMLVQDQMLDYFFITGEFLINNGFSWRVSRRTGWLKLTTHGTANEPIISLHPVLALIQIRKHNAQ